MFMSNPCQATEPCSAETLYGITKGKKCPVGDEVYHNTTTDGAVLIGESRKLKVGMHVGGLGQDVLSLSSCPTQGYGGHVKFVLKKTSQVRPMCYYDYHENKEIDRGIEKEAREEINGPVGANRIRGKYGINLSMYKGECEYVGDKDIPLKGNLKKVEYWIPWKIRKHAYNHACKGHFPSHANVDGSESGIKVLKEQIEQVKSVAQKQGVPFEVKSCFSTLKAGWGDRYIPLNKENLQKLAEGKMPDVVEGKIKEECGC